MIDLIYWLAVSAIIVVPLVGGLYVLTTPTHKLIENWQNFRTSRSSRALKDRHFQHLPRAIFWCKIGSLFVVGACGIALVMLILSMTQR
jgi:hypothetical protein